MKKIKKQNKNMKQRKEGKMKDKILESYSHKRKMILKDLLEEMKKTYRFSLYPFSRFFALILEDYFDNETQKQEVEIYFTSEEHTYYFYESYEIVFNENYNFKINLDDTEIREKLLAKGLTYIFMDYQNYEFKIESYGNIICCELKKYR